MAPQNEFIPLSVPVIWGNELPYVEDAIRTGWLAEGSYIQKFEAAIQSYTKIPYGVALNSGTSGLFLALKILDIGPGDLVLVPSLTFIATINSIAYTGAEPVFFDCDDQLNLDMNLVATFCERECQFLNHELTHISTGKKVKAIMPVHIFGNPMDLTLCLKVAQTYGLKIIEDAAESLGSFDHQGIHTGSRADIGVFSFNGNKIVTTGGGGCLVTHNETYAKKARYLATQSKDDPVHFVHHEVGYNFRLSNVSAAIGLAQIESLDKAICQKKSHFEQYQKHLPRVSFLKPSAGANYWFFCMLISPDMRDPLLRHLQEHNIQSRPIWTLSHEQKPYQHALLGSKIEKAVDYRKRILNVPCSADLTAKHIKRVCDVILEKIG